MLLTRDKKEMNELKEKYGELIYDYPLAQNLAYIYPRYIETCLKADQKENLKDAILNITGFVRRIFMKNPDPVSYTHLTLPTKA